MCPPDRVRSGCKKIYIYQVLCMWQRGRSRVRSGRAGHRGGKRPARAGPEADGRPAAARGLREQDGQGRWRSEGAGSPFWGDDAVLKPPGAAEPHGSGGPPKTPESRTSNGRMARNKNQTLAKLLPKATIGGNGQDLGSGGILRSVIESTVLRKRAWGLIRIKNICTAKGRVQGTEREPRSTGGCRLRRDEHRGAHGRLRPRHLRNGPPEKRVER